MKKNKQNRPVSPIYTIGGVFVLFSLISPIYSLGRFLLAALFAGIGYGIVQTVAG